MSVVKIGKKEQDLKFTFNSFRYMEDFDLDEISTIEKKPLRMINVLHILLMGALNHDPKVVFSAQEVMDYLENFAEDGDISELFENLIQLLQDSSFFKSLRKKEVK